MKLPANDPHFEVIRLTLTQMRNTIAKPRLLNRLLEIRKRILE
jgi:hypothetical protein